MSNGTFFLAIDLVADGIVLALQDQDGELVDAVRRSVANDGDGCQDPLDWWRAVRTGTKDLLRRCKVRKDDVRSVGLCGPQTGIVCLGAEGEVLAPCRLQVGEEFAPFVDEVHQLLGHRNIVNLTGGHADHECMATGLRWLKGNEPRVWHDLVHLLLPRDFLRFKLTGTTVTDTSLASTTRLFSPRARTWSKQALERLEIEPAWLPHIANGHILSGRVTQTAARETGLVAGTPVVVGGSRATALAISVSAINHGDVVVELGGDGIVTIVGDKCPRPHGPSLASGCHSLPDLWTLEGRGSTGVSSIEWFTHNLIPTDLQQWRRSGRAPLDMIAEIAAEAPPGSDGVHFLPPQAHHPCGSFTGLGFQHDRSHLFRSLLEGGAFLLRDLLVESEKAGIEPKRVLVTGAGSTNKLWCQILADVISKPVTAYPREHARAQGTATLATVAIGTFKSVDEACRTHLPPGATYQPRRSAEAAYAHAIPSHQALVAALDDQGEA